jgi:hypothetical protein
MVFTDHKKCENMLTTDSDLVGVCKWVKPGLSDCLDQSKNENYKNTFINTTKKKSQ